MAGIKHASRVYWHPETWMHRSSQEALTQDGATVLQFFKASPTKVRLLDSVCKSIYGKSHLRHTLSQLQWPQTTEGLPLIC